MRRLTLGSLSPTAMRIYALRLQAESSPENVSKHTAFFGVLLETADKERAKELVKHYEQFSGLYQKGPNSTVELLKDQKAFDMYLAGLAIAGEESTVTVLAKASQQRNFILKGGSSSPEKPPSET